MNFLGSIKLITKVLWLCGLYVLDNETKTNKQKIKVGAKHKSKTTNRKTKVGKNISLLCITIQQSLGRRGRLKQ